MTRDLVASHVSIDLLSLFIRERIRFMITFEEAIFDWLTRINRVSNTKIA